MFNLTIGHFVVLEMLSSLFFAGLILIFYGIKLNKKPQ